MSDVLSPVFDICGHFSLDLLTCRDDDLVGFPCQDGARKNTAVRNVRKRQVFIEKELELGVARIVPGPSTSYEELAQIFPKFSLIRCVPAR